jgi:hypothetical protein
LGIHVISLAHAPLHVTELSVVNVHVHELSSAQIWQHKLGATLSASVNINYRLPIEVYYRICTLRHIRIEINHGNQNVFWVLTSGLVDISKRYPSTHVKTQSNFLAYMIYYLISLWWCLLTVRLFSTIYHMHIPDLILKLYIFDILQSQPWRPLKK